MRATLVVVVSVMLMAGLCGTVVAGSIDSAGAPPSAGSGMYTLGNLYDFLTSGTALTVQTGFQGPTTGPGPTMKSTKQVGDAAATPFAQCDAAASDVKSGKKFFSTQPGNWGVQVGTMSGGSLPSGGIIMYSGAWNFDGTGKGTGDLLGWALCNGNNGTPNLEDKFIMGIITSARGGETGGHNSMTLTTAQIPAHSHTFTAVRTLGTCTNGSGACSYGPRSPSAGITESAGDGAAFDIRPNFLALAYVMKLAES